MKKYHFDENTRERLNGMYQAVLPLLEVQAAVIPEKDTNQALCGVTLGKGVDELQELYSSRGAVMEAYMIECLAMELLGSAYCQLAEEFWKSEQKWLDEFRFFGDALPFEEMPMAVKRLQMGISCNEVLALRPTKSVVFQATLKKTKGNGHGMICKFCRNVSCPIREAVMG